MGRNYVVAVLLPVGLRTVRRWIVDIWTIGGCTWIVMVAGFVVVGIAKAGKWKMRPPDED